MMEVGVILQALAEHGAWGVVLAGAVWIWRREATNAERLQAMVDASRDEIKERCNKFEDRCNRLEVEIVELRLKVRQLEKERDEARERAFKASTRVEHLEEQLRQVGGL